jgi:ubiquinone/menaquinone biosynthesis C-methylase UbiE
MVLESYYAPVAEEVVRFLGAGRMLDLGTGPGYLPIEIVKRAPQIRIEGIDLSRKLIEKARTNALSAGVGERIHFEIGDASRLRYADDSFDMVISTGMLHSLKKPVQVLKECRRVLKPGKEAWVYDPARVSGHFDKEEWINSFTPLERVLYALFLIFTKINPGRVYDREKVVEIVKAAGFKEYEIRKNGSEIQARIKK